MRHTVRNHPMLAARSLPHFVLATLVAGALLFSTPLAADAGGTPEQQCQAGKNKTAGKYAACRQGAEAKLATSADVDAYYLAASKCGTKFATAWQKLEAKAVAAGTTCLDGASTAGPFQAILNESGTNIATALAGGGLIDCTGDLATCTTDLGTCAGDLGTCTTDLTQASGDLGACEGDLATCAACGNGTVEAPEQCDGTSLDGETCATQGFALGTLRCASGCAFDTSGCFATRLVDNGDGTVTDHQTGLQWEQKTTTVGSGVNLADPHDVDNTYTWNTVVSGTTPNGTAFTDFLPKLNGTTTNGVTITGCFAGHCDWRLPTIVELKTILLLAPLTCGTNPCIAPVFGPTISTFGYWSTTPLTSSADQVWAVAFSNGLTSSSGTYHAYWARAVRTDS